MSLLSLKNVTKSYEKVKAVNNVSFTVPEGCIFGLLGPNGAGKTSIIRMITTITNPDQGEIKVAGKVLSPSSIAEIGYMPEERGLYKKMNVQDHLLYLARLKGLSKSKALEAMQFWFERFDINDWRKKKIEELSKGMQQKIQFIATVIHDPNLIILDEPFSGLDPLNANLIKDENHLLAQQGKQILFSTHRMEQVEQICDYIVLINKGQNVLEGYVDNIRTEYKKNTFFIALYNDLDLSVSLPQYNFKKLKKKGEFEVILTSDQSSKSLLTAVLEAGAEIKNFQEILPSLNEVFIDVVEKQNIV